MARTTNKKPITFYADPDIEKFLDSLESGEKTRTINKALRKLVSSLDDFDLQELEDGNSLAKRLSAMELRLLTLEMMLDGGVLASMAREADFARKAMTPKAVEQQCGFCTNIVVSPQKKGMPVCEACTKAMESEWPADSLELGKPVDTPKSPAKRAIPKPKDDILFGHRKPDSKMDTVTCDSCGDPCIKRYEGAFHYCSRCDEAMERGQREAEGR